MRIWKARPEQKSTSDKGIYGSLAVFADPGLGKTAILLDIFCRLRRMQKVKKALIIAPLHPLKLTWPGEIKEWFNFSHLKYWFVQKKKPLPLYRHWDVCLINPEKTEWFFNHLLSLKEWPFDVLIVDESSYYRRTQSARTKALLKVAPYFKYRYIANGTPTGNSYEGLYSQMKIVDLGETLGYTKKEFYSRYFKQVGKAEWHKWTIANKAKEKELIADLAPNSVVLKAEDYIKMPDRIVIPKFITLPPKAEKAYLQIEKDLFTELNGEGVYAQTAAIKAQYLNQICNGVVYRPRGLLDEKYIPPIERGLHIIHKEKLYAVESLMNEFEGRQILIGYWWQSDYFALNQHFKKITFFNKKQSLEIQTQWNAGKIETLAGSVKALSLGLNLQKSSASVIILYSVPPNFIDYDQFVRRLHRNGNKAEKILVYPILAKNHYDHMVSFKSLTVKGAANESFFNTMRDYMNSRLGHE